VTEAGIQIRPAVAGDAPRIVALAQECYRPAYLSLGIFECPGATRYVADTVLLAGQSASRWVVASDGSLVVGTAELRESRDGPFLNNICVDPRYQRSGVGGRLLLDGLAAPGPAGPQQLRLDVFSDNTGALAWYRSLGFSVESVSYWVEPDEAAMAEPGWWVTHGVPQADAVHGRYGFSDFDLETSAGTYRVRRIAGRLLRGAGLAGDPVACGALRELYPGRVLVSAEKDAGSGSATFPPSQRMRADADEVVRELTRAVSG
jgi:ribosomal protein S18 acetylase RimI-like enzyme